MALTLPPISDGRYLTYPHFPTAMQCFIYRNWETVDPARMAQVLHCGTDTILSLADDMGLPVPPRVNPKWLESGYITLIKANWQLLNYDQLCTLLGWNRDRLAYILKEDDFLDIKLGNVKPDSPPLVYAPLTHDERLATETLRAATREALKKFAPQTAEPFDFTACFPRAKAAINPSGGERFDTRIIYSYCALYGDTFAADFTKSFPDELLEAYRSLGINGIWCQAVLYTLVPLDYMAALSEGWEERLKGLRALTERLDRYGIKLYLYLNEPRAMPESFFERYPQIKGSHHAGLASLCTSTPEVQDYLRTRAAFLVENAPLLGGFITITASENRTNCYSHFSKANQNCPLCAKREKYEVIAEVNNLLYEGAVSSNPDFKLIAWTWGWEVEENAATIDRLTPGIDVMAVSERLAKKTIGGVETDVNDYSISVVGPGDYARGVWKHARAAGHAVFAKCQVNNSWECAAVPYLPVFELVYQHLRGLLASGVNGLMLSWTLGGFPSPTLAMIRRLSCGGKADQPAMDAEIPTLEELYSAVFPRESIPVVSRACHHFSAAFDAYPFHIGNLYSGPQNAGPSNLLYAKPTGFGATMVCFPYDDLGSWRAIYPEEVFEDQLRQLTEEWATGLCVLSELDTALVQASQELSMLCDCAEAAYCHFRSVYLQTRFVRIRDGRITGDDSAVIREEQALCVRLAAVCAHNPTIGYESSNHYFYSRAMLLEKYVNCDDLLAKRERE